MGDIIIEEGNNELNVQLEPTGTGEVRLHGTVKDAQTFLPIPMAEVRLSILAGPYTHQIYTGLDGAYNFDIFTLETGAHYMEFEKLGYITAWAEPVLMAGDNTKDVLLQPA